MAGKKSRERSIPTEYYFYRNIGSHGYFSSLSSCEDSFARFYRNLPCNSPRANPLPSVGNFLAFTPRRRGNATRTKTTRASPFLSLPPIRSRPPSTRCSIRRSLGSASAPTIHQAFQFPSKGEPPRGDLFARV